MGKSLSLPILIHLLLLAGQGGRMVSAPTAQIFQIAALFDRLLFPFSGHTPPFFFGDAALVVHAVIPWSAFSAL